MKESTFDVAIVGAGAAGLMTAIIAARESPQVRIALLEGKPKPGAKILASGGGRCNVTNRVVRPADFCGDRSLIARVLRRFDERAAVEFFLGLGVELKHEPEFDKLFPVSNTARTVLDALLAECARLGVQLVSGFRVDAVVATDSGFEIVAGDRRIAARRVVLATGGRSVPGSGSDGAGYEFARSLGHSVTGTAPSLVPLVLDPALISMLAGVAVPAVVRVWSGGKLVAAETGPVLVTHFGASGPAAMNASRHWTVARMNGETPEVRLDVFPGREASAVEAAWLEATRVDGARHIGSLLDHLPARFARRLCEIADVAPEQRLSELTRNGRKRLLDATTNLRLPVTDTRGWNAAEVTAGGVPLAEVDVRTMQSRVRPGLHFVGEILDVDGRIGGFNFQWAWATGFIAGQAVGSLK